MSDWTINEYFSTLGLLPEGHYPQEIIDEDDDSWKNTDTQDEEIFWPDELQDNEMPDRPTDFPGSPVNSLFFWSRKDETKDDENFDDMFKQEEDEYKKQHENESPIKIKPFDGEFLPEMDE